MSKANLFVSYHWTMKSGVSGFGNTTLWVEPANGTPSRETLIQIKDRLERGMMNKGYCEPEVIIINWKRMHVDAWQPFSKRDVL